MAIKIPTEIPKFILPAVARGIVIAPRGGAWVKVSYSDAVTGAPMMFADIPAVVALTELRTGAIRKVEAPKITIPSVVLAKCSTISIPSITLPAKVPEVSIPHVRTALGRFSCGWAIASVCDALNDLMKVLEGNFEKVNETIDSANDGFKKVNASLKDLRDKTQDALNAYRSKIEEAVNDGLSELKGNNQDALNSYRDRIQTALNSGLSRVIPMFYSMMGLPTGHLVSLVNTRNVRKDTFEFYALSTGMKVHYVAIGRVA